MNCPQCEQLVGNDQFQVGEWAERRNERGVVIDVSRELVIDCEHCGVFRVVQSSDLNIRDIFKPDGTRAQGRLRRHLPNHREVPLEKVPA